jgi:hypothetical protein
VTDPSAAPTPCPALAPILTLLLFVDLGLKNDVKRRPNELERQRSEFSFAAQTLVFELIEVLAGSGRE